MYSPRCEHRTGQTPEIPRNKYALVKWTGSWANGIESLTLAAVVAAEAWIALAVTDQTLAVVRAAVRAVLGHVLGDGRVERELLLVPVVVVDGHEPVTRFHVLGHLTAHRGLREEEAEREY